MGIYEDNRTDQREAVVNFFTSLFFWPFTPPVFIEGIDEPEEPPHGKCETCKNQHGYTLGIDECGSGNIDAYCPKEHWHGLGPIDENDDGTYWDNCKDYVVKNE